MIQSVDFNNQYRYVNQDLNFFKEPISNEEFFQKVPISDIFAGNANQNHNLLS